MNFPSISSIKNRRKLLGISQKELAKETELSQSLIAKLESGMINISYNSAIKIFCYLDRLERKHEKTCKEIMKKKVVSLSGSNKILEAISEMKKHAISQMPIVEKEIILGSISEDKIYELLTNKSKEEILESKISEHIEDPLPTLPKDSPVSIAIGLLKYASAVMILDKNKICGIITKSDLL